MRMSQRFLLLFFFMLTSATTMAGTVNCEVADVYRSWATIDTPFELNVMQVNDTKNVNLTLGNNISDYTVLYTISKVNVGNLSAICSQNGVQIYSNVDLYYTMFSSNNGPAVRTTSSETIYPTSVPGIGISVGSNLQSDWPITLYPNIKYFSSAANGYGFWLTVKIWKIPGALPVSAGAISFTGPTVGQLYKSNGNSFSSSDSNRLWDSASGWIASSRRLTGTLIFRPTTCNLVMPSMTVNMGEHDGTSGQPSDWKDASFKLNCPNAYGYGGTITSDDGYSYPNNVSPDSITTANTINNNPIRIQIVPRTAVVDANTGIIGLDGTGAQGYGIQLAWGDSTTLGRGVPAKPVILNSWTLANTLNSAYSTSAYAIGASAISTSADGTIKMAARYVRTTGATQPGPAKASVEVIASYQ